MPGLQEATWPRPSPGTRPAASLRAAAPDPRPGDLRGGARGLGLALLRGAGVELQQLILHGQLVPELRHLYTYTHRHKAGVTVHFPTVTASPLMLPHCSGTTLTRSH